MTDIEISTIKDRVKNDTREIQIERNGIEGNLDEQELEMPNNVDLAVENNVNDIEPHEVVVDEEELLAMKMDIVEELSIVKHTEMNERDTLLKIRHPHKYNTILKIGNKALEQLCHDMNPDLTELNELIYATGRVLQAKCGLKSRKKKTKRKPSKAKWQVKIEKEIENFRREISILEELQKDSGEKSGKARKLIRKYKILSKEQIPTIKEELKQKLQVKAQRLRRFDKRQNSSGRIKFSRLTQRSFTAKLEKK